MAATNKKRTMKHELDERTRQAFPLDPHATHLDYAELWVANGGTLVSLALAVSRSTNGMVMREMLRRYLHSFDGAELRLANARINSSHAMVEDAQGIAEEFMSKDDVPRAKLRIDTKLKVAQFYNRAEFGEQKGTNITINGNVLHLDALRQREIDPILDVDRLLLSTPLERAMQDSTLVKERAEHDSLTHARSLPESTSIEDTLDSAVIAGAIAEEAEVISISNSST